MFILSFLWITFQGKKGTIFRSDKNNCRLIEFNRFRIWIVFPLLLRKNESIFAFKWILKWFLLFLVIAIFKCKFRKSVIIDIVVNYVVILLIFTKSINEFTPICHCILFLWVLLWPYDFELDAFKIVFCSISLEFNKCLLIIEINSFTRFRKLKSNGIVKRNSIFEVRFNLIQ